MTVHKGFWKTRNRFALVFLLLATVPPLRAQFFSGIRLESGLSRFENNRLYLLNRARIRLGQKINRPELNFDWNLFYQPEIFDLNPSLSAQYVNGRFSLQRPFKRLDFLLHFRSRYQHLQFYSDRYAWQSSDLTFNVRYHSAAPSLYWSAQACLWYRDAKNFDHQKLNASIFQAGADWHRSTVLLQLRLYYERYTVIPTSRVISEKLRGDRSGISLHIEQNKNYIFSVNYRFLLHYHQNVARTAIDHEMSLLLAFWLSPSWSLLFFGEYRKIGSVKEESQTTLWYRPINATNRMYLKLSKDISPKTEFYLKFGKLKEQLTRSDTNWQFGEIIVGLMKKLKF
jgi:hypothetical protein